MARCKECFACAQSCPATARKVWGQVMTVDEVLQKVEEDSVFYQRSGGGLTLSGGEPLQQADFALCLLATAKDRRIATAIETCGLYPWEVLEATCHHVDRLFFDIKTLAAEKHRAWTGADNTRILENFQRVRKAFPMLPICVRTPVVPGFNDTPEDIKAICEFLPQDGHTMYELMPYHRLGQTKYTGLGRTYEMGNADLEPGRLKKLQEIVQQHGFLSPQ